MNSPTFQFKTKIWLYPGKAGWHFVSVPEEQSVAIKDRFGLESRGWGSLRVEVTLGSSVWKTSIFPDKKTNQYVLPLKKAVRAKEAIKAGDEITCAIEILT